MYKIVPVFPLFHVASLLIVLEQVETMLFFSVNEKPLEEDGENRTHWEDSRLKTTFFVCCVVPLSFIIMLFTIHIFTNMLF